jgi:methoxymalonate biosynthesis acyl carrier protein
MDVRQEVERFLLDHARVGRKKEPIDPDEDLLARGAIDSIELMQLVSFVEQEFGIAVTDEEVSIENFRSLRSIQEFVEHKKPTRS